MKLYIFIKDTVPLGLALATVGHGCMAAVFKWENDASFINWKMNSFRKVICKVNQKEFDRAKECEDIIVMTESALNNEEVSIVFKPRQDNKWPKVVKYAKLYK